MRSAEVGMQLRRARVRARLTQSELALRMGTSQPAIARAESGLVTPSLDFIERFVRETGEPLRIATLVIVPADARAEDDDRSDRVRRAIGDYQFDPWRRNPTAAERRSLDADGLTRESFEGERPARSSGD